MIRYDWKFGRRDPKRSLDKDMVVKATRSQRDTIINAAFDVKVTAVGVAIPS